MGVEIDEAWANYEPPGIDAIAADNGIFRERCDDSFCDAHVTDGIQAGFRVYYSAVKNDQIGHGSLCGHSCLPP